MRILSRNPKTPTAPDRPLTDLLGPPALELAPTASASASAGSAPSPSAATRAKSATAGSHRCCAAWPQLELSLHIEPFPAELAAQRLHKQRARFESTRRIEPERGSLTDLGVAAAAEDAHQLAARLARGREPPLPRRPLPLRQRRQRRQTRGRQRTRTRALRAQLLSCIPASFRPLDGWLSTLPLGLDRLRCAAPSTANHSPPPSPSPPPTRRSQTDGCFYGLAASGAPVVFDRFARDNYNGVILARSGAGKSYLAKLEALRLLYQGVQVFVVDPEDEYRASAAVGGAYLPLAGPDAVSLNPLDLPSRPATARSPSGSIFLTELVELLAGGLTGGELAALDRATRACYAAAGITTTPTRTPRPAPLLPDLVRQLAHQGRDGADSPSGSAPTPSARSRSSSHSRPASSPHGQARLLLPARPLRAR